MIKHENIRSAVRPQEVEIVSEKVFIASNIRSLEVMHEGSLYQEYEFDLTEYGKDEYIKLQSDRNQTLEQANAELSTTVDSILTEIIPSIMGV